MAEETTNQSVSETTEDDGFLADELSEESQSESEETKESSKQDTPESFLNIRYNGADKSLSKEEATTLAQKGMNYDKVYGKLQELQNNPSLRVLSNLANNAGVSVEEYISRLQQFSDQTTINEIASDYKAKNPDATDDMANDYAKMAFQNQMLQQQQQMQRQSQAQQQAQNDALIRQVQAFNERYPDVKVEDLPDAVIDDINAGADLETAYDRYLIDQLQGKLANKETNEKNKENATGKLSNNSSSDNSDPFLAGLLG